MGPSQDGEEAFRNTKRFFQEEASDLASETKTVSSEVTLPMVDSDIEFSNQRPIHHCLLALYAVQSASRISPLYTAPIMFPYVMQIARSFFFVSYVRVRAAKGSGLSLWGHLPYNPMESTTNYYI